MSHKPLTNILVKPAGPDCNMACIYCFYRHKQDIFPDTTKHRMSDEVLKEMIRQLMEQSGREVSIVWQGGEPTLMGLSFFHRAVALEQEYGRGKVVGNGLQTNGLLLDSHWARFFKRYRFLVGLSLDGPQHVHDHYRLTSRGAGTWSKTVDKAKMLLDEGVAVNALIVVNDHSAQHPEEIYEFNKDLGLTFMQFIPCLETITDTFTPAPFSVSPEAYSEFLCRLFDRWRADVHDGVAKTSIRFFESIFHGYVGLEPPECTLQRQCGTYVVVEHNGDVYSCDFFVEPQWRLGNVMHNRLDAMLNCKKQTQFRLQKAALPGECKQCAFLDRCRGGCTKDRLRNPQDTGLNYFCEGLKAFFAHSDPHFRRMAAEWKTRQLLQEPLESGSRTKIGRNDPCPCGSGLKYKKCCLQKSGNEFVYC